MKLYLRKNVLIYADLSLLVFNVRELCSLIIEELSERSKGVMCHMFAKIQSLNYVVHVVVSIYMILLLCNIVK